MLIEDSKHAYAIRKGTHDRREALLKTIPCGKFISQKEIKGNNRARLNKDLKALTSLGVLRMSVLYDLSASGIKMYKRVGI